MEQLWLVVVITGRSVVKSDDGNRHKTERDEREISGGVGGELVVQWWSSPEVRNGNSSGLAGNGRDIPQDQYVDLESCYHPLGHWDGEDGQFTPSRKTLNPLWYHIVDENVGRVEGKTCYKVVNEIICKNDDPEPNCLPACKHLVGGGPGATCVPQLAGPSICACTLEEYYSLIFYSYGINL
ncbi:hypothetical protein RND71_033811 [Anisodus tanguticus]|uniref:Uncharacterized protein n=1 Tax=Anisodus tanguticus TaxID=243964 RepID=A0AAE1RAX1_9SOLA|nr:hypothetical protein RND71_033811 [Anisodus tanguticus]